MSKLEENMLVDEATKLLTEIVLDQSTSMTTEKTNKVTAFLARSLARGTKQVASAA
jgi:hypothetical protein